MLAVHENTRIPTLEEVLDLIECYDNKRVLINLETKLDPLAPNETLPVEKYIDDIVPLLERRVFASRTTIQSFDWRTLIGIKKKFPETVTIALVAPDTITPVNDEYPCYLSKQGRVPSTRNARQKHGQAGTPFLI